MIKNTSKIVNISHVDGKQDIKIAPGDHEFPFQFQLPVKIPSSLVSFYGRIYYSITAVVDRPWKFDHETVKYFTVVGIYDLNMDPIALVRCLILKF